MKPRNFLSGLLLFLVACQAFAGSSLDTSFGTEQGTARFNTPNNVNVVGSFPVTNGKFISVSNEVYSSTVADQRVTIRRYAENGTLDTSYNSGSGTLELTIQGISGMSEIAYTVLPYPDGSYLIIGNVQQTTPPAQQGTGTSPSLFLYKLKTDGTPDLTFGTDALIIYKDVNTTNCEQVVDSKYFINTSAGDFVVLCQPDFGSNVVVVLDFNRDGTLYANFGNNGSAFVQIQGYAAAVPVAIAVGSSNIYLGMNLTNAASNIPTEAAVMRLTSNGIPDSSFANNGLALMTQFQTNIYLKDIAVNQLNPVALLTYDNYPAQGQQSAVIWQFQFTGSTQTTFGPNGNGKVFLSPGTVSDGLNLIAQPNTRLIVATNFNCASSAGCTTAISRLKADGSYDSMFSPTFVSVSPTTTNQVNTPTRLDVNPDGSMMLNMDVTPASGNTSVGNEFTTTRFVPDKITPTPFTFAPQTGVQPSYLLTTEAHQILGVDTAVVITGDSDLMYYSVNGGRWETHSAVANPGDSVQVEYIASPNYSTKLSDTVTIGNEQFTVTSTTEAAPPPPNDGGGAVDLGLLLGTSALAWYRRRRQH